MLQAETESNPGKAQVITFSHLFIVRFFIGATSCLRGWCYRSRSPFSEQHLCLGREGRLIPSLALYWPPSIWKYISSNWSWVWLEKTCSVAQLYEVLFEGYCECPGKSIILYITPLGLHCGWCLNSTNKSFFPFHWVSESLFLRNYHVDFACLIILNPPIWAGSLGSRTQNTEYLGYCLVVNPPTTEVITVIVVIITIIRYVLLPRSANRDGWYLSHTYYSRFILDTTLLFNHCNHTMK